MTANQARALRPGDLVHLAANPGFCGVVEGLWPERIVIIWFGPSRVSYNPTDMNAITPTKEPPHDR